GGGRLPKMPGHVLVGSVPLWNAVQGTRWLGGRQCGAAGPVSTFAHPNEGTELDWLALDVNQRVALFTTAGYGPVPRIVAARMDQVERAVERLGLAKVVGPCAESPDDSGAFKSWTEPCRRGLFGFDWADVDEPVYVRLTVPSRPVTVGELDDAEIR